MAKAPGKRRGITLGSTPENTASLDLLNGQPTASNSANSALPDQTSARAEPPSGQPEADLAMMGEQIDQLRRMSGEIDIRWRVQAEQMQEQLGLLKQQREQVALQIAQLHSLSQARRTSGRLGVLLALLALSVVGALGFHTWPRIQEVQGDLSRVSAGVARLVPQIQTVSGELTALRTDVSGVRTDLGSLRETRDPGPVGKGAVQASAGAAPSATRALPPNATTMANPYRAMHPPRPW
jgi:TolA-binding protein